MMLIGKGGISKKMLAHIDEEEGSHDFSFEEEDNEGDSDETAVEETSNRTPIAAKENKAVVWSRILVILVLLVAAAGASTLTYIFTSNSERAEFESDFDGFTKEVALITNKNAESMITAIRQLSVSVTSHALATGARFPMVTVNDFERKIQTLLPIAKILKIDYAVVIRTIQDRFEYEEYSLEHGLQFVMEDQIAAGIPTNTAGFRPFVYNVTAQEDGSVQFDAAPYTESGPWMPVQRWSPAPETADFVNANSVWTITTDLPFMDLKRSSVLGHVYNQNQNLVKNRQTEHPMSSYREPVLSNHSANAEVVGVFQSVVAWNTFFEDLLAEGTGAIHAVVTNDCGDIFTYSIEGQNAIYLGTGALHEREFTSLGRTVKIEAFQAAIDEIQDETYGSHGGSGGHRNLQDTDAHTAGGGSHEVTNGQDDGSNHNASNGDEGEEKGQGDNSGHGHGHGHGPPTCSYSIAVYPSRELRDQYKSLTPVYLTGLVLFIFAFTSAIFVVYDLAVKRRQVKVMDTATKTDAIVSNLFPSQFRHRLLEDGKSKDPWSKSGHEETSYIPGITTSKPMADLFPHTTIMMADVRGFTAWSSMREPAQTFILLETVYSAFDSIAKKHKVFKVETIGDCYVAVCGLPTPSKNHALNMARFASECEAKMSQLVNKLELVLGPGTSHLGIRCGLHSGPTVAGILRGEKARFQLFGTTINTASRIESSGEMGRIHLSQATADELIKAGKGHWIVPREDKVFAKGLGEISTYWLQRPRGGTSTFGPESTTDTFESIKNRVPSTLSMDNAPEESAITADLTATGNVTKEEKLQQERLIQWNVSTLMPLLQAIVASRDSRGTPSEMSFETTEQMIGRDGTVFDELQSIIALPSLKSRVTTAEVENVVIPKAASRQLKEYVSLIANSYRNNPFHNWDHASHVCMSVSKLLSRIVAPERVDITGREDGNTKLDATALHDNTYGITSDPLTQFAIVLSALLHDIDHRGVPNGQLMKEDPNLAAVYQNKSVAEQNSVDIGWNMLMNDRFKDLRACIYSNEDELRRFRQILVNSVLATDIFDKELGQLRKERWNLAFADGPETFPDNNTEATSTDINRKATIVIEHIIQASDVAHTMQHWIVYTMWNEKLFHEMYLAYKAGRSDKHPADGWYEGELWFFDNWVIPLSKKLESCGVFGVSSDECFLSASANRKEWALKGQTIVAEMKKKHCSDDDVVRVES